MEVERCIVEWRDQKPRSARSVCTWTIVGLVFSFILYIASLVLGFLAEAAF